MSTYSILHSTKKKTLSIFPISVIFNFDLYFHEINELIWIFFSSFDLFTKFLIVIGIWTVFQTMSLLDMDELRYIGMVFNLLQGPFIFAVAMCRTRVAFLFKKYFCHDSCCFGFCKSEEFINEECEELATIGKKYALKRYDQFSLCLSNNKYSVKSEYKNS